MTPPIFIPKIEKYILQKKNIAFITHHSCFFLIFTEYENFTLSTIILLSDYMFLPIS